MYWITNNTLSIVQILVLKNTNIRDMLGIKPPPPPDLIPVAENVQDKVENVENKIDNKIENKIENNENKIENKVGVSGMRMNDVTEEASHIANRQMKYRLPK